MSAEWAFYQMPIALYDERMTTPACPPSGFPQGSCATPPASGHRPSVTPPGLPRTSRAGPTIP
ncbi:hypothetical protein SSCG_00662 [Streptomyces clavuligerus]|nr:hypothetical protein SSCG_00662 [Streptomyces clavuligerus]